ELGGAGGRARRSVFEPRPFCLACRPRLARFAQTPLTQLCGLPTLVPPTEGGACMAQVNIPMALGAAFWDKQKAALAKAPKAPPTKLGDELKALTKLHTGIAWEGKAFSADKLNSADDAKDRSAE